MRRLGLGDTFGQALNSFKQGPWFRGWAARRDGIRINRWLP